MCCVHILLGYLYQVSVVVFTGSCCVMLDAILKYLLCRIRIVYCKIHCGDKVPSFFTLFCSNGCGCTYYVVSILCTVKFIVTIKADKVPPTLFCSNGRGCVYNVCRKWICIRNILLYQQHDAFAMSLAYLVTALAEMTHPLAHSLAHSLIHPLTYSCTHCNQVIVSSASEQIRTYRKLSNIRRTKSQNLNDSRLVLHLSLPNLLKPCVK